jgi:hypothetical protein
VNLALTVRDFDEPAEAGGLVLPVVPLLWVSVLTLALLLRFVAIEALPLASDEAARALEAFGVLRGTAADASSGPVPVHLMAIWFGLFTPADGPARQPSALLGWLFCLTPLLFSVRLGSGTALAAAALIAVSPTAVLASRTAGPAALVSIAAAGLVGSLLLAQARNDGRWLVFAALPLAAGLGAGPAFIGQLLAIGLATSLCPPFSGDARLTSSHWGIRALMAFLAIAVLLDTLFLTRPSGLQAGLIDPFANWPASVGLNGGTLLGVGQLLAHELVLVVLVLAGLRTMLSDPIGRFLTVWAAASAVLALLSRSPDLAMATGPLMPLALLSGRVLSRAAGALVVANPRIFGGGVALLVPLIFLLTALNGQINRGGPASLAPLLIAAGGVVAVVLLVSTWLELAEIAQAAALALGAGLLAVHLILLTELNYDGFQRGGPFLLNRSSAPVLRQVEARAEDWWRQAPIEPIQVDSQLRPLLAWSLRNGPPVEWSSVPPARADRAILGASTAATRPAGDWLRLVIGERYRPPERRPDWQSIWRWLARRESIFRSEPDAILIPM